MLELISLAINTDIIYPVSYNISEHLFSACLILDMISPNQDTV